jgi:hypothetical protein
MGVGRTSEALGTTAEAGALLMLVREVVAVPTLRMDERSDAVVDMRDVRADAARDGMRGGGGGARRPEDEEAADDGRGGGLGEGLETGVTLGCRAGCRWGSLGGLGVCCWPQLKAKAAAVVGLAIDNAETSSNDSSKLTLSASGPVRSMGNVAIWLVTDPTMPPSVVPPSDESETEWKDETEDAGA